MVKTARVLATIGGDQRVGCASAGRVRHDHAAAQRRRHDGHQKQSDDNARTHWNEAEEGRNKRSGEEDYGKSKQGALYIHKPLFQLIRAQGESRQQEDGGHHEPGPIVVLDPATGTGKNAGAVCHGRQAYGQQTQHKPVFFDPADNGR